MEWRAKSSRVWYVLTLKLKKIWVPILMKKQDTLIALIFMKGLMKVMTTKMKLQSRNLLITNRIRQKQKIIFQNIKDLEKDLKEKFIKIYLSRKKTVRKRALIRQKSLKISFFPNANPLAQTKWVKSVKVLTKIIRFQTMKTGKCCQMKMLHSWLRAMMKLMNLNKMMMGIKLNSVPQTKTKNASLRKESPFRRL